MNKKQKLIIFNIAIALILIISCIIVATFFFKVKKESSSPLSLTKLILYSSLQESQLTQIKILFEKLNPDITLEFQTTGSGKIVSKLLSNLQLGDIQADLVWIGDPASFKPLIDADLLLNYVSDNYRDVDEKLKLANPCLTTAKLVEMGFIYNTKSLESSQVPRTWEDILKVEQLLIPDPAISGTMYYTLLKLSEIESSANLENANLVICSGSGATGYQVGSGKYSLAIVADHVASMISNMGLPVSFIHPIGKSIIIPSPIAIIKNSKHQSEAKRFIDFILSDMGQALLASLDILPVRGEFARVFTSNDIFENENNYNKDEFISAFDENYL